MSSPNLPDGAFLTSINGRRCTAIPKQGRQEQTTREAPTTTARQPTPTPPARETPTPANPPPQQQNPPPQDDTPARASSSPQPDPPQRDPPQAEPPRQTQADPPPPPQESREPTSTSSTTTASPSPVITPSTPPPQPIRTVITPPPAASQVQNPLVPPTPQRPPPLAEDGRGPILVPSLTPPSPIGPPPLADEQPRPGLPSLSTSSSPAPGSETGAQSSSTTASDTTETSVLVPSPPAAPVLTPPTSPLAPVFPSTSDTQPSAVESSRTDQETAPTQANPGNVDGPQSEVEAPLGGASSTDDAASLITSAPVPIGSGGSRAGEDAVTTTGSESPLLTSPLPGSSADSETSGMSAAIIAGAVVGGVAFLTICALLFWFWRKNKKKRRSTLLTPLSTQPPSMRKERPYIFDQESVGPTPRSTKFKAALGYSLMRLRGQVGGVFSFGTHRRSSSAVLSKEQSQQAYSDLSGHSRHGSNASSRGAPAAVVVTSQDRARDWWDRLKMDALFNWRTRRDGPMDPDPFASVREKQSETVNNNVGQPDFLTLLGMDEREVEREAQRRRASRKHGSTASMDHFLSGLGLGVDKNPDPFSDRHALPAKPTRAAPTNPFDDSNAVVAPGFAAKAGQNYIEALQRSRGTSMGGLTTRPPSTQVARSSRYDSVYRESGGSVDSFTARRNKWRSDPFDLERPDLLSSQGSSVGGRGSGASGALRRPSAAHMRSESMQSKYSSGVGSMGWSEPGPDVGASGGSGGRDTDSPTSGYRPGEQRRRLSSGSQQTQGSVGKAM